jgi:hypothetical protein
MYANLLGWNSLGIELHSSRSAALILHCFFRTHLTLVFSFMRWALSTLIVKRLRRRGILQPEPTIVMLEQDVAKLQHFDIEGGRDVVVYCWDRGLSPSLFAAMVHTAAASSQVKGKIAY